MHLSFHSMTFLNMVLVLPITHYVIYHSIVIVIPTARHDFQMLLGLLKLLLYFL